MPGATGNGGVDTEEAHPPVSLQSMLGGGSMKCFCGRQKLDPEWSTYVFEGVPCCSFACFALAELTSKNFGGVLPERSDQLAPT